MVVSIGMFMFICVLFYTVGYLTCFTFRLIEHFKPKVFDHTEKRDELNERARRFYS